MFLNDLKVEIVSIIKFYSSLLSPGRTFNHVVLNVEGEKGNLSHGHNVKICE